MTAHPILSTVNRDEFVGRDAELREVVYRAVPFRDARGLVIQAAPGAGAGELLRQAYDQLFMRRRDPVPIHFGFMIGDVTAMTTARRFFQTILQQFIAYRRVDPSLCKAPLTFHDLLELAPPSDYELISNLIESFESAQNDERDLLTFSFSLPHRLSKEGRTIFPLIDCLAVRPFREETALCHELVAAVSKAAGPFVIAGRRRQIANLIHQADTPDEARADFTHLETLGEEDARRLIDLVGRRYGVQTNESTRDLIVQQLNASPFFIKELIQAAHEAGTQLTSYLKCQKLYVDDVLGGHIKRYFDRLLLTLAPNFQTRRTLLRVLFESASSETRKSSLWAWKKRLGAAPAEFERIIEALHAFELVNSTAAFIEVNSTSQVWMDYLRAQYQVEVATEPRAKVVAITLLETLKRAPETMRRKYRRESSLGLGDLLERFDCQSVPASLLHYDRFARAYKGEDPDVVDTGLEAESDLIRLPQIVYTASAAGYAKTPISDEERCTIAHGFEAGEYTDENEVVWLTAEVDSKLEASRELSEVWWHKLTALASESDLRNAKIWLVAPEGFSDRACEMLNELGTYTSSRQQFELLTARVKSEARETDRAKTDEYEIIIPMGDDTELIAAQAVEQIARRFKFKPEAINQIKTALVEACINATEHSLSPDRKIYQRFIVEGDKLVVTVASRGVVPAQSSGQNGQNTTDQVESGKTRRGWGLKLIKTLMDEVEFERVDDGTQLKMTKYLR
jgi:serine/threonine-protein kinase RsbW